MSLKQSKIKWYGDKIRIRPSAIDTFYGCSYQWARVFLGGETSITSARAAIGTAIHKAAEVLWTDAMEAKSVDPNVSKLTDAAIQELKEIEKTDGVQYDNGESFNTATVEIVKGTEAFVEDIVPFTSIPSAVEEFFKVDLDHPVVEELGGTVDYIHENTIADLKTTRRKAQTGGYVTQQSTYKYLAEQNGYKIEHTLIQNVIMKKQPEGAILLLESDVEGTKAKINYMLDTLDVFYEDKVHPDILFRGNPKYHFCSSKYCAFYNDCPFVKGDV